MCVCASGKQLDSRSSLLRLHPFLDKDGILRVGGRIDNASATYNQRHPIILPKKHHVTDLIIRQIHYRNLHAGPRTLLYIIREQFWPLQGLRTVNTVLSKCMNCFKANLKPTPQLMGDLPSCRLMPQKPFNSTGIDYAGPIKYNNVPQRSHKVCPDKAYVVVFVCMTTGAVHLELATSPSTQNLLATFHRFISRRGKPEHIYSDNGGSFVAFAKALKVACARQEIEDVIGQFAYENKITWHFIPPLAPHMGGRWEAHVKIMKLHLKRTIGKALLKFEELNSLIIQIEGMMNSRPITEISSDPTDFLPLTPGHFLIGNSITSFPEQMTRVKPIKLTKEWREVENMKASFWKRWKREYLNQLQNRYKWHKIHPNLKQGQLVIVTDPTPPFVWKLGRVITTHPGRDGNVRVVLLKTSLGPITRPVNLLCPLPIDEM